VQIQYHFAESLREQAGYFKVPGAHLYTVLHQVDDPVARVLLVGAFASERHNSYLPWVRWARYLAAKRIEVLRYDYRGIGESRGVFEDMTFDHWYEDVLLLADWLQSRSPNVPLVLHGLELGALLAGKTFHAGIGDALLLWSPPANANQALRSTLLRWVGLEQLLKYSEDRISPADYIRRLDQGSPVEIEGYEWSATLWRDSFGLELPPAMADEQSAAVAYNKPIRILKLPKQAAPLVKGGAVGYDEVKDFSWLFAPNADWIVAATARTQRGR
jgi:Serine aminopeptidase, S33